MLVGTTSTSSQFEVWDDAEVVPTGLQAPQHSISRGTIVVLPRDPRAFLLGQRWQDLSVLLVYVGMLPRGGSLQPAPQPLRYELNYAGHDGLPWFDG